MTRLGRLLWRLGAEAEARWSDLRRFYHSILHGTVESAGFRGTRWRCRHDGEGGWH